MPSQHKAGVGRNTNWKQSPYMDITIDTVLEDYRLKPLFGGGGKSAVQLWTFQKKDGSCRLVYGWVVPYHYSNNSWHAPKEDRFKSILGEAVQVVCLSAYLDANNLKSFLSSMYDGNSIKDASSHSLINMGQGFEERFGNLTLDESKALKPVTYLPSSDNYEHTGLFSPYTGTGANSASMVSLQKETFIQSDDGVLDHLYEYISDKVRADTGLDLSKKDASRVGDLEILSFPTLDEYERSKLEVVDSKSNVKITYFPDSHEEFDAFALKIDLLNNNQIFQSNLLNKEANESKEIIFDVPIDQDWMKAIDGRVIELFGRRKSCNELSMIFSSTDNFIREISLNMNPVSLSGEVKNPWLTKYTKLNKESNRVKTAQTVSKSSGRETSTISTRDIDPWVNQQRKIKEIIAGEFPEKTEGKFFPRHTEGEGRLEFVEWWKSLFDKHAGDDFVIFDPYFESVGVYLIACNANGGSNVTIFTSKSSDRIGQIKSSFDKVKDIFSSSRLSVYSIPDIHDRYLLITEKNGRIMKGFSLSNSIQKANENFPLLVTPITRDIIPQVGKYIEGVLADEDNSVLEFCSKSYWKEKRKQSFSDEQALSANIKKSISIEQVVSRLDAAEDNELFSCWNDLSLRIANTDTGSMFSTDSAFSQKALNNIFCYLEERFRDAVKKDSNNITSPRIYSYFGASIDVLLSDLIGIDRDGFCQHTKLKGLNWGDYYASKLLYLYQTEKFISFLEDRLSPSNLAEEPQEKLELIAQCISEISLSCLFDMDNFPLYRLISSEANILKWIAYSYVEIKLNKSQNIDVFMSVIGHLDQKMQVQFIGWLLNRNLHSGSPTEWTKAVIDYLLDTVVPNSPTDADIRHLVESMRGRMKELSYISSWFPEKIINPIIKRYPDSAKTFLSVWIDELENKIEQLFGCSSYLSKEDVMMTDISAQLFSMSPDSAQSAIIQRLDNRLKRLERDIRRPLAPSINWNKWDASLKVVAWLNGFLTWCQFYTKSIDDSHKKIGTLGEKVSSLLKYKPKEVWMSEGKENNLWVLFFDNPDTGSG